MTGISTAEKRLLLEAAGEPWPTCECHGVPLTWHKKKDGRREGGTWKCTVRHRKVCRDKRRQRWHADPAWADQRRAESRLYWYQVRSKDPAFIFREMQYKTLYNARKQLEKATNRAEEMYA